MAAAAAENANGENGGAAAGTGGNVLMKYAKKLKSKKQNRNAEGNPIRKTLKAKTMTLGRSSKNRANKTRKAKRAQLLNQARDPKEQVYKKLSYYSKEAQDIYDEEGDASIDKAKKLIALIEKLYYRMPTPELKEIVEVEIDTNTLAESILDVYKAILKAIENETKDKEVDELANIFKSFGF